ncbi:type II secretion system protein M [Alteromonas lipolytica]|uniref:MSHA biogenesis protein MshJ n=1 Tax=Alteromonas lipolytica TaxID=1856405 RepID=A0A1E8F8J7_9ALTE|nr:type II secretion system protein M [Alteromonas lipolytica]OFI32230.1 hypothetical protein BFC17_08410 [Alteromonas lipolytica]GGF82838.1 MSHA biogenesis protein MshJ [Alteromonas lipolytica]
MTFAEYEEKFAALSQREKLLIFVSGMVIILSVLVFLMIEPAFKDNSKTSSSIDIAKNEVATLQQLQLVYQQALAEDPDASVKQQIAQVDKRMQRLQENFANQLSDLILPRQMPPLIEQVFSQADGLKLIEMASISPENIFADNPAMQEVPLYQHGVTLTFEGRFFAVRDFLARLEQMSSSLYWRSMAYHVKEYPQAEVTLEVYTLSTEKAFIGVE